MVATPHFDSKNTIHLIEVVFFETYSILLTDLTLHTMSNTPHQEEVKETPNISHAYWHHLLTKGKRPESVYAFAYELGFDEGEFYQHASSFEALEASYWASLVEETIEVLHSDEDYAEYEAEQKFLAFFFTFFTHIQSNRSRLTQFFPRLGCMKTLKPMRAAFVEYAKGVIAQGISEGSIADRKKFSEKYPELIFEQLRGLIEFHRKDESEGFQDTDAFIEKSVRFGSDMARSGSLDSAFDLGRFLLRRFTLK